MLNAPGDDVDLALAKLTIDKLIDPTVDIDAASGQLNAIVEQIRQRLPANPTNQEKLEALRTQLYTSGPWNCNNPFRYDLDDPLGHSISNKLLPTYLATRKGNCISMPFLFIALGQQLGLDVTASTAPNHVFVKYRDPAGALSNLETTSGAGVTSDGWIQRGMPMTPEAIANGIYLQRLTRKETVVVMLGTLMEYYGQQDRRTERIELARFALEKYPKDVQSILTIHSTYGRMVEREFGAKYATARDIPITEWERYRELLAAARSWRAAAEALGWREPDEDSEKQYRQSVDTAKSARN